MLDPGTLDPGPLDPGHLDPGHLDPGHLDLFRAVVRHGGMTRAAQALGIGQPHVSRAIARLEAGLGFALFVRGRGSAVPTREGEAFAREVERTHAGLEQLRRAAADIRERGSGTLQVASQPSLAARFVPRAIRRFCEANPGARVSLQVPAPDAVWSLAASGQCDVGLARPRPGHPEVLAEPFLAMDAVCVVPRGHRLAAKRVLGPRDLAGEPLISNGVGHFQRRVEEVFAAAGVPPRFTLAAQYTSARCGLVAEGLGVAIVDPLPARAFAGLPIVLRPFRPGLPIETMLLLPMHRPPSLQARRMVEALRVERDAIVGGGGDRSSRRSDVA